MEMISSHRGDKHEISLFVIKFKHVRSCPSFHITMYMTALSEGAQIFYLGEQTSVIVSHQQLNDV